MLRKDEVVPAILPMLTRFPRAMPLSWDSYNFCILVVWDRGSEMPVEEMGRRAEVRFGEVEQPEEAHRRPSESETRLRALLMASSDAVYCMSADWGEMRQMKGTMQDREFLVENDSANRNWLEDYIHPDDQLRIWSEIQEAIRAKRVFELEHRVRRIDGTLGWTHSRAVPLFDENGEIREWFGMASDVTLSKQSAAALLQNEKLAATGRLAASIAHEINNPLESVTNLIFLARASEDIETSRDYLEMADRELRRAAAITSQTLRFYRQSTDPTEVSSEELTEGILMIHQGRILNSRVRVEKHFSARPVLCFDGEIRQVLSNLVGNAIDAMHPLGGRLLVRSREGRNWKTSQRGLVITVADTGQGMSPQTLLKVFEAFYTTKGIGGTGLGLWVSKEIVDRHEGSIRVKSSQNEAHRGTVVQLFLPYAAAKRV